MQIRETSRSISLGTAVILVSSCVAADQSRSLGDESGVQRAVATVNPTAESEVNGTVAFTATEAGVEIQAELSGLTSGDHGFHIHEFGDCSAPDGTSAGGHFNPEGNPHGAPSDENRHVGDLGNLTAGDDGLAHYERTDTTVAFAGAHSVIGRAVVIHAGRDDMMSQPTGGAGARAACGVIGIAR